MFYIVLCGDRVAGLYTSPVDAHLRAKTTGYDGCEYRTHWDWEGNVEIWWVEDEAWRC